MLNNKDDSSLFNWLKTQPELCAKLDQIRELEADARSLDKAELELLELVKTIGASSLERILQNKSQVACDEKLKDSSMRVHGKKTHLQMPVRASGSNRNGFALREQNGAALMCYSQFKSSKLQQTPATHSR